MIKVIFVVTLDQEFEGMEAWLQSPNITDETWDYIYLPPAFVNFVKGPLIKGKILI